MTFPTNAQVGGPGWHLDAAIDTIRTGQPHPEASCDVDWVKRIWEKHRDFSSDNVVLAKCCNAALAGDDAPLMCLFNCYELAGAMGNEIGVGGIYFIDNVEPLLVLAAKHDHGKAAKVPADAQARVRNYLATIAGIVHLLTFPAMRLRATLETFYGDAPVTYVLDAPSVKTPGKWWVSGPSERCIGAVPGSPSKKKIKVAGYAWDYGTGSFVPGVIHDGERSPLLDAAYDPSSIGPELFGLTISEAKALRKLVVNGNDDEGLAVAVDCMNRWPGGICARLTVEGFEGGGRLAFKRKTNNLKPGTQAFVRQADGSETHYYPDNVLNLDGKGSPSIEIDDDEWEDEEPVRLVVSGPESQRVVEVPRPEGQRLWRVTVGPKGSKLWQLPDAPAEPAKKKAKKRHRVSVPRAVLVDLIEIAQATSGQRAKRVATRAERAMERDSRS